MRNAFYFVFGVNHISVFVRIASKWRKEYGTPNPCYLRYFQILYKIDSFPKKIFFRIKNVNYIFEELSNLYLTVLLISFFPCLLWITAGNRTWRNYLFELQNQVEHNTINTQNYTWLFISNCNNVGDILDWTWFLHFFWLQEFIQQQTSRLMNKKEISLTQQIRSLHLKNPLRKYVIRLLLCVPFSLGSICKYWIYVINGIGIFTTLSDI